MSKVGTGPAAMLRMLGGAALAAAGTAAGVWWKRSREREEFYAHLDHISDPVENPWPLVEAMVDGVVPHKVLASYRYADGDTFILGIGSRTGEVYYLLALGLPPAGDKPDFEASWKALLTADTLANEEEDRNAVETCLNVRYAAFEVPEDAISQRFLRRFVESVALSHGEQVEAYKNNDPEGFLNSLEGSWLFASPVRRARARLEELT